MLSADILRKLESRQEELATVFVDELDATRWPDDLTQQNRGDRYWLKKNAGATATLIVKIQTILDVALKRKPIEAPIPGGEPEEEDAMALAGNAIAEAEKIIRRARGTRFGKGSK